MAKGASSSEKADLFAVPRAVLPAERTRFNAANETGF